MFEKLKNVSVMCFFSRMMAYSLFWSSCCCSGSKQCLIQDRNLFLSHMWGHWALVHMVIRALLWWVALPSVTHSFPWSVFSHFLLWLPVFKANTMWGACVCHFFLYPTGENLVMWTDLTARGWHMWPLEECQLYAEEGENRLGERELEVTQRWDSAYIFFLGVFLL